MRGHGATRKGHWGLGLVLAGALSCNLKAGEKLSALFREHPHGHTINAALRTKKVQNNTEKKQPWGQKLSPSNSSTYFSSRTQPHLSH